MSPGSPQKTPKTPGSHLNQPNGNYTPGHLSNPYRLLYRGALSLPDSHLLLDGLTFTVKLESPSKHVISSLLDNPLALALESMRGRPSLRFLGVIKLADVYMDDSGSVEMYVFIFDAFIVDTELGLQGHPPSRHALSHLFRKHVLPKAFPE